MATPFPEKTKAMDEAVRAVMRGEMSVQEAADRYGLHPRAIRNRRCKEKRMADRSGLNPALMIFGGMA